MLREQSLPAYYEYFQSLRSSKVQFFYILLTFSSISEPQRFISTANISVIFSDFLFLDSFKVFCTDTSNFASTLHHFCVILGNFNKHFGQFLSTLKSLLNNLGFFFFFENFLSNFGSFQCHTEQLQCHFENVLEPLWKILSKSEQYSNFVRHFWIFSIISEHQNFTSPAKRRMTL